MLFSHQQEYLKTVPDDNRVARIFPFDPKVQIVANSMIRAIQEKVPDAKIFYQGSSMLGIAGENDIDLTVVSTDFKRASEELSKLFGPTKQTNPKSGVAHWDFVREGFPVDMGLQTSMTDLLKEQLSTQKVLENNKELRLAYEKMKLESNGLPWKEYLVRKYKFWNKLIGQ